ncbi:MAG: octanoyltransferase, partial [Solibacillus sp.]
LLLGFRKLGLDAYFSVPESQESLADLKKPKSAVCFDAPSWYELVVEGKKVAGSAQTRQKGVILQHGAILLELDEELLLSLFHFASPEAKEKMRLKLPEKAVAMNRLATTPFTIEQCVNAFSEGFEEALDIDLVPYELTAEQLQYVKQIEQNKYLTDEWNFKK